MSTAGWRFEAIKPSGLAVPFYPAVGGSLSHDWSRPVRRAIGSLMLLPDEAAKLDLVADKVKLYLVLDDVELPMGLFSFNESTRQLGVVWNAQEGETSDILITGLADQMIRLRRSEGFPEELLSGSDPSQAMQQIFERCGLKYSVTGSIAPMRESLTWAGDVVDYDKITTLAEMAGHRPPWADNAGVIRSIEANVVETDVIDLLTLKPVNGTVGITENYLSAPNRVIVFDNGSANAPIVGQWDAPASAPHSESNRGWVLTERVSMQGLSGGEHARQVAETLGERFTARSLDCQLAIPTDRLDGPVILSFDDALWMVTGWSISLEPNSTMTLSAMELL